MKRSIGFGMMVTGAAFLAGCDSQPSQSLLPDKQDKAAAVGGAAAQVADPLLGMWKWESDRISFTDRYGTTVRKYDGTFLVEQGESPGRYRIRLNFRSHSNIGSLSERYASAEEVCIGVSSGSGLSIQCTIDPVKYPDWIAADFSFPALEGQTLRGTLLSDSNAPVVATKI